jgi:oligopeptide transport system substrate-binding protein
VTSGLGITRLVLLPTVAIVLAACTDGDTGRSGREPTAISIYGCDPEQSFIPTNTAEPCGGNPMDQIFEGLVRYDPETAAPENAVASDISSDDNVTWHITIDEGWKFHDGTDVTAESFVRAWNWGAYGPNRQLNSYFFAPIKGYLEVQGNDVNGDDKIAPEEAPVTEMSGLTVVSDTEFTVELAAPSSVFPTTLGYIAFAPLPATFLDDPEAFGAAPIGNGPFEFVSYERRGSIKLTAFDDFAGTKPEIDDVVYKIYVDVEAGYADLISDNLDILGTIPPAALADDAYREDLGDRVIDEPAGWMQYIAAPQYLPEFANPDLTRAISMAIDRETVVNVAFNGSRTPATGWVSPVVNGYRADACGSYCIYNPVAAKELFDSTGFTGPITIRFEAGSGHETWVGATCTSIANALHVECQPTPSVDFATYLADVRERKVTGLFKAAWIMDYPSIENFLVPQFATEGSANDSGHSDANFDAAVAEAATLQGDKASAKYQEAEAILAEDFPVIPLWYVRTIAGYSNNIGAVQFTPFGTPDLASVRLS